MEAAKPSVAQRSNDTSLMCDLRCEECVYLRIDSGLRFLISVALGFCALLLVVPAVLAHGQAAASTATIHGHIADQTGALIPGAKITVTNADGNSAGTATADASGAYAVMGLEPGSYIVKATYAGFADFQSQPIPVAAGQVKRVDVAMAIEVERISESQRFTARLQSEQAKRLPGTGTGM